MKYKKKFGLNKEDWIVVFAVLVVILGVCLFFIRNYQHNKQIREDINKVESEMRLRGFDEIVQGRGCGRTQVKYGEGPLVCTLFLEYEESFGNPSDPELDKKVVLGRVNVRVADFYAAVDATKSFEREGDIPIVNLPRQGFTFGSLYHRHIYTGRDCGGRFDFSWDTLDLSLSFNCDDTSWYSSNFQDGK